MLNRNRKKLLVLTALGLILSTNAGYAAEGSVASVSADSLPINVADPKPDTSNLDKKADALVSPSQAKAVAPQDKASVVEKSVVQDVAEDNSGSVVQNTKVDEKTNPEVADDSKADPVGTSSEAETPVTAPDALSNGDGPQSDFNFDLKMKAVSAQENAKPTAAKADEVYDDSIDESALKDIQYTAGPMDSLGNSILSKMDSDLFKQMSDIEKSMTLLTLELRREKIRNEIEAQKAIRRKNADDFAREQAEEKLKMLEREEQIKAQVVKEKQILADKQKMLEVLKQRKLLNAYMNQMLVYQQDWLKEKENLYAQIDAQEQERRDLIEVFRQKVDRVLEASAKNIQVAEEARANFQRIVKGLKARNEQLRKRIEADAEIIKNARNNLYMKSQSLEELKDKNAALSAAVTTTVTGQAIANNVENSVIAGEDGGDVLSETEEEPTILKLSSQYAILGIVGRENVMSAEVIDANGQPVSLKIGSPLPTGHVVSEIGSDYIKFSRDGVDEFLYVGRTIDGIIPTLDVVDDKNR